jgi:hypothetical protein
VAVDEQSGWGLLQITTLATCQREPEEWLKGRLRWNRMAGARAFGR